MWRRVYWARKTYFRSGGFRVPGGGRNNDMAETNAVTTNDLFERAAEQKLGIHGLIRGRRAVISDPSRYANRGSRSGW